MYIETNLTIFLLVVVFLIGIVSASCLNTPMNVNGQLTGWLYNHPLDMYSISGSCNRGDEVNIRGLVDSDGFLTAVFNQNQDLLYRQMSGFGTISSVILRDPSALSVGFANPDNDTSIQYSATIERTVVECAPPPRHQRILLDFDGAEDVYVSAIHIDHIPPLGESWLAGEYPGQIDFIKQHIKNQIQSQYSRWNVEVYSTDGPLPAEPYATVYFGGYMERLLGLADNVDQYNIDPWQYAIVFVDSFQGYDWMNLNAGQMASMMANVGAHESGHLLGLSHVAEHLDIMDTTGTAWDLVWPQVFMRSPLEDSVFRFGFSNSPYLLNLTVGPFGDLPEFECSDSLDNDNDRATDYPDDFSCSSPCDNDETNPKAQCQDGVDNDGDGLIDYLHDPECSNRQDNKEEPECFDSDGGLNYGVAGYVTYLGGRQDDTCFYGYMVQEFYCEGDNYGREDVYCEDIFGFGATCSDGACKKPPQCNDHLDNDHDGFCDYSGCYINETWHGADPDCTSPSDDSESPNGQYFYSKTHGTGPVVRLLDNGEIYLTGRCLQKANCVEPANSLFVMRNSDGETVSYIDSGGNLCIEQGDCVKDYSCSVSGDNYAILNEMGTPKIVFKEDGSLCFTGRLREGVPLAEEVPIMEGEAQAKFSPPTGDSFFGKIFKFIKKFVKGGD